LPNQQLNTRCCCFYITRARVDSLALGKSEFGEQTKGEAGQSVAGAEETDKDGHIGHCK